MSNIVRASFHTITNENDQIDLELDDTNVKIPRCSQYHNMTYGDDSHRWKYVHLDVDVDLTVERATANIKPYFSY